MSRQMIPLDITAIIIDYAAEDVTTLKNLTLTSQDFCMLGQAHIFSTVLLDGSAKRDRLIFFEGLLDGDRGQIIAGYIKNLYLLFCDDWFAEEEGSMTDDTVSELASGTMIEFIAEHARRLRCIHVGPFFEIHLDWHDISHNVRNAITHILVCAEDIALEGFVNVPIALFQSLQNVKSLDISHVIPSLSSFGPPPPIPSPTSLAIHLGLNGSSINPGDLWDMTSFLRNMTLGMFLNFSNLTTLYLHLLDDPNKYSTIKQLLSLCANSLRTLRLYIWEHDYTSNVIDFSQLPALQSLTLATDLSSVESSLQYLSEAINTIGAQQLNDLRLVIDTEGSFADWTMELTLVGQSVTPQALQTKISQILRESNARIAFEFPSSVLQPEEVLVAIGHIFDVDHMESAVKERLAFTIQEYSITNAFTLRTEAEIQSANPIEGDDETIPE